MVTIYYLAQPPVLEQIVVDAFKRPPSKECMSGFIRDFSFKNLGI